MRKQRIGASIVLLGLGFLSCAHAAPPPVSGKRVQCWTDDQGQRACGDSIPPQYAKQQREIFDAQGRIREIKPREKTAAEIAAEEQAARDKAEAALQAQKRRDYDRFLLGTYNRDKDIERARDERLAILDGRSKLIEKALSDNDRAIAQQQARVDNAGKDGKQPSTALTRKLEDLKQTREANQRSLSELAAEKQKTTDKYAADLARFRELRGEPAAPAEASDSKPAVKPAAQPGA